MMYLKAYCMYRRSLWRRNGFGLHGLGDVGDLDETRTGGSF